MRAARFLAWTYLVLLIQFIEGFDNDCHSLYPMIIPYQCSPEACVSCRLGFGVAQFCNRTSPTICHPCEEGYTFSDQDNPYSRCSHVSLCSENMVVDSPATTKHDITCKCADGYIENAVGICLRYFLPTPTMHHQTVNAISNKYGTMASGRPTKSSSSPTPIDLDTNGTHISQLKPNLSTDKQTLIIVIAVCATVVVTTWAIVIIFCYRRRNRRTQVMEDNQMLPLMASESSESVYVDPTGVHVAIGDEGAQSFSLSCPVRKWYLVPVWNKYHWTLPDSKMLSSNGIQQKRSKLIFSRLSQHHAGLYSYEAGSKKSSVHLLVKRDLKPVLNVEGVGAVELSFTVWGSEEPCAYQWYKDGTFMSNRPREYTGETSSTLKIISTSTSMRGQYHCVARCALASIRSRTTRLNIICNPQGGKKENNLSHSASTMENEIENESNNKDQGKKMVAIAIIHNSVDGSDKANIADETEFMNDVGTKSETELSRQVVAQASTDDTLITAKYQYLKNLSEGMIHQLGMTMEKILESVLQMAAAVHIENDILGTFSRTQHPGVVLLEELRDANPYYPLAQLCLLFSRCGRLDCIYKLQTLITQAGGRLPLPAGITAANKEL